ncbi:MAG: hypothetical protein U7126_24070 [Microcoleus sp.]
MSNLLYNLVGDRRSPDRPNLQVFGARSFSFGTKLSQERFANGKVMVYKAS